MNVVVVDDNYLKQQWHKIRAASGYDVPEALFVRASHWLGLSGDSDYDELFLVLGCQVADAVALAHFEAAYLERGLATLRYQKVPSDTIEETLQRLRVELLVIRADEEFIRLVRYAGQGRLASLVRVSATRYARYLRRHVVSESTTIAELVPLDEVWAADDPQIDVITGELSGLFKRCFSESMQSLQDQERALLRFRYIEGLTFQQIAELFQVNRATMCRRVAVIRGALFRSIRRLWRHHTGDEVEQDVVDLLACQLDLSISRLLRGSAGASRAEQVVG